MATKKKKKSGVKSPDGVAVRLAKLIAEHPDEDVAALRRKAKSEYAKAYWHRYKRRLKDQRMRKAAREEAAREEKTESPEVVIEKPTNGDSNLYQLYTIPEGARRNIEAINQRIKRVEPILNVMKVGQAFSLENAAGPWARKYLNEKYPNRKYVVSTPKNRKLPAEVRYVANGIKSAPVK